MALRSESWIAPSRISALQPDARASIGWPGTAITSRPWSSAWRAVIRLPDLCAASTTTTALARPEMMRLRSGKCRAIGSIPGGCSDTSAPASQIRSASFAFSAG